MNRYVQKIIAKQQEKLIDMVFRLMFETLRVSPYDQRRTHAAMCEFEQSARHVVMLLRAVDLRVASEDESKTLNQAAERLVESMDGIDAASLFHAEACTEARSLVRRVAAGIREQLSCGVN